MMANKEVYEGGVPDKDAESAAETENTDELSSTDDAAVRGKKCKYTCLIACCCLLVVIVASLVVGIVVLPNLKDSSYYADTTYSHVGGVDGSEETTGVWLPSKAVVKSFDEGTREFPIIATATLTETYGTCQDMTDDIFEAFRDVIMMDNNALEHFHENEDQEIVYASTSTSFFVPESYQGLTGSNTGFSSSAMEAGSLNNNEDSWGTNNQDQDGRADEADTVKSDGVFVFAAYGKEVVKIDADTVKVLNRTAITHQLLDTPTASVQALLLEGDRLVTISTQHYGDTLFSIYDKNSMTLLEQKELNGEYVSARSVDGNVHVVTRTYIYDNLLALLDEYFYSTLDELLELVDQKKEDMATWLIEQVGGDCSAIQRFALFQDKTVILPDSSSSGSPVASMAHIYSFSISGESSSSKSIILPESNFKIYSSPEKFVVSALGYKNEGTNIAIPYTYIMSYGIAGAEIRGEKLGTVPGYVLNQFSVHHAKTNDGDFLYVATTTPEFLEWHPNSTMPEETVSELVKRGGLIFHEETSQVSVLDMLTADETMPVVGQVEGLGGPNQRIYSVRFQGDKAYVVTFDETDPFYTLDLNDPFNPTKVGELEILGFSVYLHPVDDDLVLGVGQDADSDGHIQGLQVSLFNVSDFANPVRVDAHTEETSEYGFSTSAVEWNHRAFRFLEGSNILILPVAIDDYGTGKDNFDGFRLYNIDGEAGKIEPYFSITHGDDNFHDGCWSQDGHLEPRSLVFDGNLMTLKQHSVLSHDLETLKPHASPINLDENLGEECSTEYFGDGEAFFW